MSCSTYNTSYNSRIFFHPSYWPTLVTKRHTLVTKRHTLVTKRHNLGYKTSHLGYKTSHELRWANRARVTRMSQHMRTRIAQGRIPKNNRRKIRKGFARGRSVPASWLGEAEQQFSEDDAF
eukprot:930886-Prorocentrum_minimum.AAC.1